MSVQVATTTAEACEMLAADPEAMVLAGGTDFMVEVNYNIRRPPAVVAIDRIAELGSWQLDDDSVTIGAAMTYTAMGDPLFSAYMPALAQAARTVGSPQIRNAGTTGGNLATASPAGDTLPVIAALDGQITVRSVSGRRQLSLEELITGPKRNTLEPGEVIESVTLPVVDGPQEFLKVGTRNAMVISVATVALVMDRAARRIRVALGSVGPTVLRAPEAEEWVSERIDWGGDGDRDAAAGENLLGEFGARVAGVAQPIDDHRSSAAYRRHAVEVMARRALARALS